MQRQNIHSVYARHKIVMGIHIHICICMCIQYIDIYIGQEKVKAF